jgi:tRNA threonylcarbamoyl adenosine modification protein YeaZ
MPVLLLDTSTDYAIVGICDQAGNVISSRVQTHDRQLSVRLYTMISEALADAGIDRNQIDALSVGLGPGSFTGVRVAVTTMRTLAQVLDKPLVAFGTLDALTQTVWSNFPERRSIPTLTMLPSRRDEVYAQAYINGMAHGQSEAISYSQARTINRELGAGSLVAAPKSLLQIVFDPYDSDRLIEVDHPSVRAIASLTAKAIQAGDMRDPLSLDPMYVAPPAVSQHKKLP